MKLQAALATLLAVTPSVLADAAYNITGTDILNFALNLECLEAEFYSYAVYGEGVATRLEITDNNKESAGKEADLKAIAEGQAFGTSELAKEIADDEIAHVKLLRSALGDLAVDCPKMSVGPEAFQAAFKAATADNSSFEDTAYTTDDFDPYQNDLLFLHGAFIFEDVGVTAYAGAVPALAALVESGTVGTAAQILAAEAYHAGAIRDRLIGAAANGRTAFLSGDNQKITVLIDLISKLRDGADGDDEDKDQGIGYGFEPAEGDASPSPSTDSTPDDNTPDESPGAGADGNDEEDASPSPTPAGEPEPDWNYIPTAEASGLVFARTVPEVLNIVYLGETMEGGFFPEGVNGVFGTMTRAETNAALEALSERIAAGDSECSGSAAATDPRVDSTTDGEEDDDNAAPSAPRGAAVAAAGAAALLAAVVFG